MSRSLSYYKSQLKSAAKSGPQYVTIVEYRALVKDNGNEVVFKFMNDNIVHEEAYKLGSSKLTKFNRELGFQQFAPHNLIDKQLWIVIRHNITIDDKQQEVKREAEIVHYSADEKMPNFPSIYEEYDIAAI